MRKWFSEKNSYKNFTLLMLAVAIWTFLAMLEVISTEQEVKILFSKLSYIGIVSVPVLWFFFSYEYVGKDNFFDKKWIICFWFIPAVTFFLVMTNEYHGLIWPNIYPDLQTKNLLVLRYERGYWFVVNSIHGYTLTLIGLIHIFIELRKNKTLKDYFPVIVGVLAPLMGNGLYLTRTIDFDYAPAAFSLMCMCFAWAIISGFFERKMAVSETIYKHLDEAVFLIDEKLNVVSMNPYAEKLFKISGSRQVLSARTLFSFWDRLEPALTKEVDEYFEVVLENDNTFRWFSVHHYDISRNSQYAEWIISMIDITEKKRYEEELQKGRIAAEAANVAKSQFLANISHEIRTPLNGIIGFTDLLSQTSVNKEQSDFISEIKNASYTLFHLVNEVLDFSKIEAGKMDFEKIDFSLSELISNSVSLCMPDVLKKNLNIFSSIDEGTCDHVKGDPIRLKQILINLMGNAVKFTETGHVKLSVRKIDETENEISLRFEVSDTGIGIPADKQKKLFELFTQADSSTTRKYGGTGLGLSIVKRIITLMGGEIWVESEEGMGACFIFTISLEKAEGLEQPNIISEINSHVEEEQASAKIVRRILLVEDIEANRKLVSIMLKKLGCTYDVAVNGQEAVEVCHKIRFDLIFMDCQMPVMDGYFATRHIKMQGNLNCTTPIIAMTAHALDEDREKCSVAGMDDYITKPINQQILKEMLIKWS
jgi:signal transduction histidine kinase